MEDQEILEVYRVLKGLRLNGCWCEAGDNPNYGGKHIVSCVEASKLSDKLKLAWREAMGADASSDPL